MLTKDKFSLYQMQHFKIEQSTDYVKASGYVLHIIQYVFQ